jgi:hypothetical protein
MTTSKRRWGNVVKDAVALAAKKGLHVRGVDNGTWCITLPNGGVYTATSTADMVKYIRGY